MGLNSFWSFSWRYSLVYWLIVKTLSLYVLIFVLPWKKTASTWSKPHYCVPNIFFPVLSRETNLSKRKYIKDELVLFPASPRNLNFVSFDVFKSQHFSTTSRPAQHQKSVLRKLYIVLHEGKNVISADKFVRGRIRVCDWGERRHRVDCWSWWKWGRNSIRKTNCKLVPLRKLGNYISIGN